MEPKKCLTKKQKVEHWIQCYLQAKTEGDKKKMKMYEAVILKLKGTIPRL